MFVHLRSHSSYSLLTSALRIEDMAALCRKYAMPALALTDCGNLFGALEFSQEMSACGIQPIAGCCFPVLFEELEKPVVGVVATLAKSAQGYSNLMALSEMLSAQGGEHIPSAALYARHEGLIFLTGGADGPLHQLVLADRPKEAQQLLKRWLKLFSDRLYIELQRHDMPEEKRVEPFLLQAALSMHIPVVAVHEPYFPDESFYEAHDVLLAVSQGKMVEDLNRKRLSSKHYFTSQEEMFKLFEDVPEAIENTVEIARRIGFRVLPYPPQLPKFVSDEEDMKLIRQKAHDGLQQKLAAHDMCAPLSEYVSRLDYELDIITRMQFSGYFLIVSDFILWAKGQNIPVGPGRGSGAGSLVAWALSITELDPLRFGLLFERFLNPERVSLPDFDVDFCQERRDKVIAYVREKYGQERVAHIITFGKLQARAVLRDVGRVLGMPYGQVDNICKLVPFNPAHPPSLQEAVDGEPRLQQERASNPVVARLIEISLKLEGLYRHASVHAAGVVIGQRPLRELIPLYQDPRSQLVTTQFSMKWVEKAGLVKFDFLGLKTLSVIAKACELLAKDGITLDITLIPFDDAQTFALLSRGETIGIFQLEVSRMRDVLKKMKPNRLEDVIALVALNRPGPMDNIPRYIHCKNGLEKPEYMHEKLKPVLEETYGIIVYQEQVMQIAQILSGYSPGDADLLRRAMGKKIQEEMDAQRKKFIQGAQAKGVPGKQAERIFELVNKFAGYGFNKSHAAAYAVISYQTAYLKANHPLTFMAAAMTLDMGNIDKMMVHREEMERLGLKLYPPDINKSDVTFVPADNNTCLYYGLGAIKNVGVQAMEQLVHTRQQDGPFKSIFDFLSRCHPIINKKNFENLVYAGALDCLYPNRAELIANVETLLKFASGHQADRQHAQQMSLFEAAGVPDVYQPVLVPTAAYTPMEALHQEFVAIGFYLSDHPLNVYASSLKTHELTSCADLFAQKLKSAQMAGVVTQVRVRKSRQGVAYAFVTLSDTTGQFEFIALGKVFDNVRDGLVEGALFIAAIEAEWPAVDEAAESDTFLESDEEEQRPRMKAVDLRELKRAVEGAERGVTGSVQHPSLAAPPAATQQLAPKSVLNVSVSKLEGLNFLKKHVRRGGQQAVQVHLSGIIIDNQAYEAAFLLGEHFDINPILKLLEDGMEMPFEKLEVNTLS